MRKYKNKLTTGLGLLIIVAGVLNWYLGKSEAQDALIITGIGLGLIAAKDHNQV